MNDKDLMNHVDYSPISLDICSDGGVRGTTKKGTFKMCDKLKVWFDENAVANILCFADVKRLCKIRIVSNGFTVTWPNNITWKFTTNIKSINFYIASKLALRPTY